MKKHVLVLNHRTSFICAGVLGIDGQVSSSSTLVCEYTSEVRASLSQQISRGTLAIQLPSSSPTSSPTSGPRIEEVVADEHTSMPVEHDNGQVYDGMFSMF